MNTNEQPNPCDVHVWSDGTWCHEWIVSSYTRRYGKHYRTITVPDDDPDAIDEWVMEILPAIFPKQP